MRKMIHMKEKKQVYSGSETQNAENEYSKLRAQNSTILNNYFDNDKYKKCRKS